MLCARRSWPGGWNTAGDGDDGARRSLESSACLSFEARPDGGAWPWAWAGVGVGGRGRGRGRGRGSGAEEEKGWEGEAANVNQQALAPGCLLDGPHGPAPSRTCIGRRLLRPSRGGAIGAAARTAGLLPDCGHRRNDAGCPRSVTVRARPWVSMASGRAQAGAWQTRTSLVGHVALGALALEGQAALVLDVEGQPALVLGPELAVAQERIGAAAVLVGDHQHRHIRERLAPFDLGLAVCEG